MVKEYEITIVDGHFFRGAPLCILLSQKYATREPERRGRFARKGTQTPPKGGPHNLPHVTYLS